MNTSDKFQPNRTRLIKGLLALNGLSQRDVAALLGISGPSLSAKVAGRVAFSDDEISFMADLLHVSADVLLGRKPLEVK